MAGARSDDETRSADGVPAAHPASEALTVAPSSPPSTQSLLATGGHGRFAPGTVLGDRYRIVARLGQGGMGEVYRADDLRLGQPVALKFLPESVEQNPVKLAQLHNEIRLARRIAHKNVCRVYDLGEANGLPFLSMEYVGGEDLASLLRRVGRLPEEKGLEISRQICAGLASAHELGILHRDLKPANVMLDSEGVVRIMDFGLAAVSTDDTTARVGTPAYMAPEQLLGQGVTVQSDVYALGLILFEVFTGRRVFEVANLAELVRRHEESSVTPPTELVGAFDPRIERTILACLERAPDRRPHGALAVAARLPGGDPLAALVAAGETPSPDQLAAAGESAALPAGRGVTLLLIVIAGLAATAILAEDRLLTNRIGLTKPPAVLVDRAQQILHTLGYRDTPRDTAWGFELAPSTVSFLATAQRTPGGRDPFVKGRPQTVTLFYRTSPRYLVPLGNGLRVGYRDPALDLAGMTLLRLDAQGRMVYFTAVPPQVDPRGPPPADLDWSQLLRLADFDPGAFHSAAPSWTPRVHADHRVAWEGRTSEWPEVPLRVEAASFRGRLVYFQLVWPWSNPNRQAEAPRRLTERARDVFSALVLLGSLAFACMAARLNYRAGRGDRRGALRLATAIGGASLLRWGLLAKHVPDLPIELERVLGGIAQALLQAATVYVVYLALEPMVRRLRPDALLGWTRLIGGHLRDPRVGRDVLAGSALGVTLAVLGTAPGALATLVGRPAPPPRLPNLDFLPGSMPLGGEALDLSLTAVFSAMVIVFLGVLLRVVLRRGWLATASLGVVILGLVPPDPGLAWLGSIGVAVIAAWAATHLGLLTAIVMFVFNFVLTAAPLTINTSSWVYPRSALSLGLLAAIAVLGFVWARAGEPLLKFDLDRAYAPPRRRT